MKLQIYLADLTHIGTGVASEAFPINIGLVASYAKKILGKDIEVSLFKNPLELLDALNEAPPHVLGCSNYNWNCNLSYYFTELAKSIDPGILTVWGGTNYPFEMPQQEQFLRVRPKIDLHIFYEGEIAFVNILRKMLSLSNRNKIFLEPIEGCQFISPEDGSLVSGEMLPRICDLDSIPSPYVTGLLDKFFDGIMSPLVETARGCPFACNFCNAGNDYFNSVYKFSNDYVRDELTYIAQRSAKVGVNHVTFADNNFGMIPRDSKTAGLIFNLQQNYGWPKTMTVWTGKNSKQRVIEVTRILGGTLNISMAVQSMDNNVLKNIERDNIRLDDYRAIASELAEEGRPQFADVIMLLPGETLESQIKGFEILMETKVDRILGYNLTMLHGTPYKDSRAFLNEYEYVTKFRLVVRNFSKIEEDLVFDVEEVAVTSRDMSFGDYIEARRYLFIVDLCLNSGIFKPLLQYLKLNQIKVSDWIRKIYTFQNCFPAGVMEIFDSFERETTDELWDSQEDLAAYYSDPKVYRDLMEGKCGGNVLYKHRVWMYSQCLELWVKTALQFAEELLAPTGALAENNRDELDSLRRFLIAQASGCYSIDEVGITFTEEMNYDILQWLKDSARAPLKNFKTNETISLLFYFDDNEIQVFREDLERFGADLCGIIKLLQRRYGKLPLRSVKYAEKLVIGTA
tara:strand:- start:6496 stop:8547 length:2052 start_codon:yes stop_codon:yes gene_type:complete